MEELALYNSKSAFFTKNEIEILKAKNTIIISQMAQLTLISRIKTCIKAAYFKAGFAIKGSTDNEIAEQTLLMSEAFMLEALKEYPNITMDEIEIAFSKGVLKEYGEYMGLSVVTFMEWIKIYLIKRREVIHKQKQIESKTTTTTEHELKPSANQIEAISRTTALKAFEIYKTRKHYDDFGNATYHYLVSKGLINLSVDEKKDIYTTAKTNLILDNDHSFEINRSKKNAMIDFLKALENKEKSAESRIIAEAKRIALNNYFASITELNIP